MMDGSGVNGRRQGGSKRCIFGPYGCFFGTKFISQCTGKLCVIFVFCNIKKKKGLRLNSTTIIPASETITRLASWVAFQTFSYTAQLLI